MGPYVKYDSSQVRSTEMKTCDVIPYFTKPELLDKYPEISLLEKKQLNDTLNKFKCNNNHTSYLKPDGSVSRLARIKNQLISLSKRIIMSLKKMSISSYLLLVSQVTTLSTIIKTLIAMS